MWLIYAIIVSLLIALVWLTRVRVEHFMVRPGTKLPGGYEVPNVDLKELPDPHTLFQQARELLNKYDKPDVWNHAAMVMDKDPGQLARMHLGIHN